jgi:hypothetical protein
MQRAFSCFLEQVCVCSVKIISFHPTPTHPRRLLIKQFNSVAAVWLPPQKKCANLFDGAVGAALISRFPRVRRQLQPAAAAEKTGKDEGSRATARSIKT